MVGCWDVWIYPYIYGRAECTVHKPVSDLSSQSFRLCFRWICICGFDDMYRYVGVQVNFILAERCSFPVMYGRV